MSDPTPPDPSGAPGPYGQGWADDGGYLPPPGSGPAGPGQQPPPGGPVPPGQQPPPGHQQPPPGYQQPPPGPGGPGPLPPAPYPGMTPLGWITTPWGPRWRGPIGEAKSKGTTVLLSIITCGIWTYVWSFQTHEELKRYRGDGLGGAIGLVLAILVSPAVMFTVPAEIEKMYQEEGLPSPVQTTIGLWFLLPIIGNFIWYFRVQDALNDFWVARGATPA